jgi:hypothetical protein
MVELLRAYFWTSLSASFGAITETTDSNLALPYG